MIIVYKFKSKFKAELTKVVLCERKPEFVRYTDTTVSGFLYFQ